MLTDERKKTRNDAAALRVALTYSCFAALWIVFSDAAVGMLFTDPAARTTASGLKGLFFVGITAVLLYFLVVGHWRRTEEARERQLSTLNLLASIADGSEDAIFAKDLDGRYLVFNRAASVLVGKPAEEVIGLDDRALFPAEQVEKVIRRHREVIATNRVLTTEDVLDTTLGPRVFMATKGPLRRPDGTVIGTFGISRDVTERRRMESDLQLWAQAFQKAEFGLAICNPLDNTFIAVNPAFARRRGYVPEELAGRPIATLFPPELFPEVERIIAALDSVGHGVFESEHLTRDGERFPVLLDINLTRDAAGRPMARVAYALDITDRKKAEAEISNQVNFDQLTRLPNRRLLHDRLEQEIGKAHRDQRPCALLFVDLDRFKDVNDTRGHDVGDRLLFQAAERIHACVRDYDTVARFGGDEFVVVLPSLNNELTAGRVSRAIIDALSQPFSIESHVFFISASIGIALYPGDARNPTDLIKCADQAMYKAKNDGRGCFRFFTSAMQESIELRAGMSSDLRHAIEGGQLSVKFQPIVDLGSGRIRKAEALLRWRHPVQGEISPAVFIPIAEESGLIQDIGDWVFRQAVQHCRRWRDRYDGQFQVSINKSPAQFRHLDDLGRSLACLDEAGLSGEGVVIEITEGLLMNNDDPVSEMLLAYRDARIQVAIDDFGTGYSALSYLKKFDIDYLKIDRIFTGDLAPDSPEFALCEAIVVMAHKLGLKVVAEGIETDKQLELLKGIGCDYGQGCLFSRPLAPEDFERLLATGEPRPVATA